MVLEAIQYRRGHLQILDQLRLPHVTHYDAITNAQDGWNAIKAMRVRGAPAIAIVAILSLAVELETIAAGGSLSPAAAEVAVFVHEKLDYLVTARPTAVNLHDAAGKMGRVVDDAARPGEEGKAQPTGDDVKDAFIQAAEAMLVDDVRTNEAIGKHGAEWILAHQPPSPISESDSNSEDTADINILTICNTGSLATAGYGTALGVIRTLHTSHHRLQHAYFLETRPYNQGARLTAYELLHDGIPSTLIADSMAGALLRLGTPTADGGPIAAVVVGADRVVRDGSTANKIGTYALAVLARYHGVKFLVAAPRTSIDLRTAGGGEIVIEERPEVEMTTVRGPVVGGSDVDAAVDAEEVVTVSVAAPGVKVWNPAFDVTPPELIDGIITEVGVVEKDDEGRFESGLKRIFSI